jgi:hypothetical protein
MEAAQGSATRALRARSRVVLALFAATAVYGVMLLIAFEPGVQHDSAAELVARGDDAKAFLIADYLFIALFAVAMPLALWRFGAALEDGSPPRWIWAAVVLLVLCGLVDVGENSILYSATDSVSPESVDDAHALALPKLALFGAGLVLTMVAAVRALRVLRLGRA